MKRFCYFCSYAAFRALTFPFTLLSYKTIHRIGKILGLVTYYFTPRFRKRALSNLALASTLNLTRDEIVKTAKESAQNLMIVYLEFPKLSREKNIHKVARCLNPEKANKLISPEKGVILFGGHLSNWEIIFLEMSIRMKAVAIGRPFKNFYFSNWILRTRQMNGGKIIPPDRAVIEGSKYLKTGHFLGIVGDHSIPDSGLLSNFLGKKAWTSSLPAILAYKMDCPILVATPHRVPGGYEIHYSDPIFPDKNKSLKEECPRLMHQTLEYFEQGIIKSPGEWLWSHNRWKKQLPGRLKGQFYHDSILIILEELEDLSPFREIYPREFITLLIPERLKGSISLIDAEYLYYNEPKERYLNDFRFKLVFNFTKDRKLHRHFLKQAAFTVVDKNDLQKIGGPADNLSHLLKKALLHAR